MSFNTISTIIKVILFVVSIAVLGALVKDIVSAATLDHVTLKNATLEHTASTAVVFTDYRKKNIYQ